MQRSRPMRAFHILSCPGIGGIEKMLSNLIPRIDTSRCEMRIVNMADQSPAYKLWDKVGVKYMKLKTPGRFLLGSVKPLANLLEREQVDIVEIYGLRANIIGRLAARRAGVPVIITGVLNTDDWRKWYHTWLDRLTRGALTGWLANSEACKHSLVQREKHPAELIKVMYDGIDVNYWQKGEDTTTRERIRKEFGCGSENIMCVTVANLREQKGHTYLMEAAAEVLKTNPQMRFVLIGADFLDGAIQTQCKNLCIEHAVIFVGHRKDIRDIYEAADITVMPSLWEGLPISLTESMSMEQPVLSTTVSGIPELVVDGVTGLLVPPRDVEALTKALLEMGGNDKKRKAMGQAGRQRVNEKFTIERMIEEKLEYYHKKFELVSK